MTKNVVWYGDVLFFLPIMEIARATRAPPGLAVAH